MHAAVRRMPVERVRHAKRLVVVDSTNATSTGSTSTLFSLSSQSTSSSAETSSSPPTTTTSARPSSATSSATTSSTLTSTSSSTPIPTTTPSSTPVFQQTTLTLTNTPSPTSTQQPNAAASTNSGLSGGAIAGIIAGSVIVGVAIIVFLVRKTYLRRREHKHMSWNAMPGLGANIPDEPKFPDISERLADDLNNPQANAPMSPFETYGQSMYSTPVQPAVHMQPTVSTYAPPALPSATYNNPTPVTNYPTPPMPLAFSAGNPTQFTTGRVAAGMATAGSSMRAQHAPVEAMVKCTFVPTLPDELSITTGERIFILEQYDDGWVLGANGRGERGMVPRDCLEHASSDHPGIGWRNARSRSSLNPDGNRF